MSEHGAVHLTDGQERAITRGLQLVLVGVLVFGIVRGSGGIAVNAAVALVVTALPALLQREVHRYLDPGVTLFVTVAVVLHVIGILGPYRNVWWYDHLTHAVSGFVATGVGYAALRAIDGHTDAIDVPGRYYPLFLLIFAVATGVFWEVIEFTATTASSLYGGRSLLIVFGPQDIVTDLVFSAVGGLVLALWGTTYFQSLAREFTGVITR